MTEADRVRANFAYFSQTLCGMTEFWIAVRINKWTQAYDALKEVMPDLEYERVTHIDFITKKRISQ